MRTPRFTRRKWRGFMTLAFLGRSSILAKKCSHLTLASSLLLVNFDLDGMDLLLLLCFFPMVQLRLKMKLLAKSSKWTVTNSSFFMRALRWKRSLWQTSLWSCQFYVIMCHEWHLRSFLLPYFIYCLFVCISLHAYIKDNVDFKWVGKGLENLFAIFCILFLLFLYLFYVSV